MNGALERTVYQVRTRPGATPEDILNGAAQAVWEAAAKTEKAKPLDPHLWPELYGLLRSAFNNRLVWYGACGKREECKTEPERVFWPGQGSPPKEGAFYLLELHGDIDRFFTGMADVALRRLRRSLGGTRVATRSWEFRVRQALRTKLSDLLYFSPACAECPVREGAR